MLGHRADLGDYDQGLIALLSSQSFDPTHAMSAITIRNLDDTLKARLRLQAARHGRSMEEEARQLLRKGLDQDTDAGQVRLTALAQTLFGTAHGLDLTLPPREAPRDLPDGWLP